MKAFNPDKELRKIQKGSKNKILYGIILFLLIISIGSTYALYQVRYSKRIIYTKVGDFNRDINVLAVYVDDVKINDFPSVEDEVVYDRIDCDNNEDNHVTAHWDYDKWGLVVETTKKAKCNVYFKTITANDVIDFAYNGTNGSDGTIQTYTVPKTGRYKLEVWGAQGGALGSDIETGGLGGYSVGEVTLTKGQKLYIGVGGQGQTGTNYGSSEKPITYAGGFNGGGNGGTESNVHYALGGGGATHIALVSGLLKELNNKRESILIVAGGGGGNGGSIRNAFGGSGGGINGNVGKNTDTSYNFLPIPYTGTGGTQTEGGDNNYNVDVDTASYDVLGKGTFGQGGDYSRDPLGNYAYAAGAGGGGGFFGGGGSSRGHAGGGGGSGYIGNDLLSNKVMYCYECATDNNVSTKTITTNNVSEEPISIYAKQGNGAARITYLGE